MVYLNNMSYRGEWMADQKSGAGLLIWPDGSMYHGSFVNDMAEGKGKIMFIKDKKERVLYEEYWIRGVAIRILSTHVPPIFPDPTKIVPGDLNSAVHFSSSLILEALLKEWQELLELVDFECTYSGFITARDFLKVITEMGKIVDSARRRLWFSKLLDFCIKWEGESEGSQSRTVITLPHHNMECFLTVKQVVILSDLLDSCLSIALLQPTSIHKKADSILLSRAFSLCIEGSAGQHIGLVEKLTLLTESIQPTEVLRWAVGLLSAIRLYVSPSMAGIDVAVETLENEMRSVLSSSSAYLPLDLVFSILSMYNVAMNFTRFNESSMRLKTEKEKLKNKIYVSNVMSTTEVNEARTQQDCIEILYMNILAIVQQSLQRKIISYRSFIGLIQKFTSPKILSPILEYKLYMLLTEATRLNNIKCSALNLLVTPTAPINRPAPRKPESGFGWIAPWLNRKPSDFETEPKETVPSNLLTPKLASSTAAGALSDSENGYIPSSGAQSPRSINSELSPKPVKSQVVASDIGTDTGFLDVMGLSVTKDNLSSTQLDATDVSVEVVGHEIYVVPGESPYVLYHCEVTHNMATRLVKKRFREARVFHGQLGQAAYGIEPPPYHIFTTNQFEPSFLLQREKEMRDYFSAIASKPMIAQNPVFINFFELNKMTNPLLRTKSAMFTFAKKKEPEYDDVSEETPTKDPNSRPPTPVPSPPPAGTGLDLPPGFSATNIDSSGVVNILPDFCMDTNIQVSDLACVSINSNLAALIQGGRIDLIPPLLFTSSRPDLMALLASVLVKDLGSEFLSPTGSIATQLSINSKQKHKDPVKSEAPLSSPDIDRMRSIGPPPPPPSPPVCWFSIHVLCPDIVLPTFQLMWGLAYSSTSPIMQAAALHVLAKLVNSEQRDVLKSRVIVTGVVQLKGILKSYISPPDKNDARSSGEGMRKKSSKVLGAIRKRKASKPSIQTSITTTTTTTTPVVPTIITTSESVPDATESTKLPNSDISVETNGNSESPLNTSPQILSTPANKNEYSTDDEDFEDSDPPSPTLSPANPPSERLAKIVLRELLEFLTALTSGTEAVREDMVNLIGLLPIVELLERHSDLSVRATAARLLANFCFNEEYKRRVVGLGALPHLLEFAKKGLIQINNNIPFSELKQGAILGQGAFAKVYRGKYKGEDVAIKVFSEGSVAFRVEDFYKEVAIMCLLSHDNVVGFRGACIEQRCDESSVFIIVTELMELGSLRELVEKRMTPLPYGEILKYALSISEGMAYVHSLGIIHRDLKCDNVLVNKDNIAKVADLGLAREVNLEMTSGVGTPKWEAPEVLSRKKTGHKSQHYTPAADVYSFSMVLYELVMRESPYKEVHDIFQLKKLVCDLKKRPKFPASTPAGLISLAKACWHPDPKKRPPFKDTCETIQLMLKEHREHGLWH